MIKRLTFLLLVVIALTATLIAFGASQLSGEVFQNLLEQRIRETQQELQLQFRSFDLFMQEMEKKLDRHLATVLPQIAQRIAQRGGPGHWDATSLQALAREFQVRDLYLIDSELVVFSTSFPPDQGLDLGRLSPTLKEQLDGLLGSGRLEVDRISMSSKTGIIKKYAYHGPAGSDYLVEASLNLWEGAAPFGSEAEKRFFLDEVFQGVVNSSDILLEMDLFIADDQAQWSLLHEGVPLDPGIARLLTRQERVEIREPDRLTLYTPLPRMAGMSGFRHYGKTVFNTALPQALVWGITQRSLWLALLVALLAFGSAQWVIHGWLARRVSAIDQGLVRVGGGNYEEPIPVAGRDELSRIASAVNTLADRLQMRERELLAIQETLEQRVAERTIALRESLAEREASESKYRFLVEHARSVILRWRPDGRVTFCNDYALEFFGFPEGELLGRPLQETIVPPVDSSGREMGDRLLEIGRNPAAFLHHENENRRADGRRVWLSWSNRAMTGPDGTVAEILSVGTDITPIKEIEAQLIHARDAAHAANRAKSEFLAMMSHEIRTPMHVILGMGGLLEDEELTTAQRELLAAIKSSGQHLLELINDILDLSKVEAGHLTLEERPFPLPELVDSVAQIISGRARDKGLPLEVAIDPSTPTHLLGDATRLRQVLVNLLGNAVKFTESGRITLAVAPLQPGPGIQFTITDTGIGIAPEHLELVFNKFTQADTSITRRFGGTGLGLSLSKRLVELMGGRIRAESQLGSGSTFHLHLPLPATPAHRPPPPTVTPAPLLLTSDTGRRVLLVEDAEDNQRLVQLFLQGSPHRLTIANDGAEAVERIQRGEKFDLVLMDVQMPVMDGYTATRRIREWEANGGYPRLCIAAFTAHALEEEAQRSREAGCDLFLTKPIRKQRLLEEIARRAGYPAPEREA